MKNISLVESKSWLRFKVFLVRWGQSNWIGGFLVCLVTIFLIYNVGLYKIPNTDFFQYVDDASYYMNLRLPVNIHAPPANPVLIGLFSQLFQVQEVLVAKLINVFSVAILTALAWLIGKRQFKQFGLAFFLLFISNPLHYLGGLNISSETLFAMMFGLIYFLYQSKQLHLAIITSALAYLIRYEALAILAALFVVENGFSLEALRNFFKKKVNLYFIVASLFVSIWTTVVFLNNITNNVSLGNTFLHEIVNWRSNLPQLDIITNLDLLILWHDFPKTGQIRLGTVILFFLIALGFLCKTIQQVKKEQYFLIFYAIFYIVFHVIFPFFSDRYFYPILLPIHLLFFSSAVQLFSFKNSRNVFVGAIFVIIIISSNLLQVSKTLDQTKYNDHDKYLVAEWLNNHNTVETKHVLTYQPWVVDYFVSDESFSIIRGYEYEQCIDVQCILEISDTNTVIVTRSQSAQKSYEAGDIYLSSYHHAIPFQIPDDDLELLDVVEAGSEKVEFYKYSVLDK